MHEQFEMLVEPTGAIELFLHANALPLMQTVPTGHALHPTTPKVLFSSLTV